MTKEEAIELLEDLDGAIEDNHGRDYDEAFRMAIKSLSAEVTKKKAELKENGDWDCPDVGCDECDHHRSVSWCSLAIPNHEEIDDTYKMVNEAFFEGFHAAESQYRLLIEEIETLDRKLAEVEWIPVSERLPNVGQDVLFCDDKFTQEGYLMKDGNWLQFRWSTVQGKRKVTAWMPLPKPYREDGEKE